ncbi:autotransporter domain-containing protein [Fusobacterium varium]|uniref:autotransporter domain-containing protein n=1 Tax=Fusobacterium varium TaxID=856 RepID=UPI000E513ADB|nr:autotransporter outer membrane beta-barrel domain-containing protein [Fusobacterium varium]RHG37804.1 autotransporter domain-containing protein [Fusobacterium varium]
MIEKIMKAVKSSNKKRSRNITIGTVIGFLLSCTAVMGADSHLWIKGDNGKIEFNITETADGGGKWEEENPYSKNNWDTGTKTYTNNTALLSNGANGKDGNKKISYGLRLSGDLTDVNFINNDSITGEISDSDSDYGPGYGIYNESTKMGNIENTGKISGTGTASGYGIYNNSAKMGNITNTGEISGTAKDNAGGIYSGVGSGIYNSQGTIVDIENTGRISGTGSGFNGSNGEGNGSGIYNYQGIIRDITNTGEISGTGNGAGSGYGTGYGIYNYRSDKIGDITNRGLISGTGKSTSGKSEGYGIYNSLSTMGDITNEGVISGTGTESSSASTGYGIYNDSSAMGAIENTGLISGTSTNGTGILNKTYNNNQKMEKIINTGIISGSGNSTSGASTGYGINNEAGTMGAITNEGVISGAGISTGGNGEGYGIYNSAAMGAIENTGLISGTGYNNTSNATSDTGSGIHNKSRDKQMGKITNIGIINGYGIGESSSTGTGYGINNESGAIGDTTNIGVISGYGSGHDTGYGYGISNVDVMGAITNTGIISGYGNGVSSSTGSGISNITTPGNITVMGKITNTGIISGSGNDNGNSTGYGIYNGSSGTMGTITNTGVIYGKDNAIKNDKDIDDNAGTITAANNYGILVTKGNSGVDGLTLSNNYGLIIKNEGENQGDITAGTTETQDIPIPFYDAEGNIMGERKVTIENVTGKNDDKKSSFDGNKENYILNALTNTYKVTGENNNVTGSIINAYGTAVVFGDTGDNNQLTLSGTIVNGGIDEDDSNLDPTVKVPAILGSGNGDNLILQSGKIKYTDNGEEKSATQNTIVNGNIDMGAGDDTLTIGDGTILNGTLDGGEGNDILNFGISSGAKSIPAKSQGVNIIHNISNFQKMNINTNVTLFEKTLETYGKETDLKVTGADEIKIGKNGTLTLRINSSKMGSGDEAGKIIGHALYGNTGEISSTDGGKLLLALNGAGNENIISFGSTTLGDGLVPEKGTLDTTSALHTLERIDDKDVKVIVRQNIPGFFEIPEYEKLNKIYHGILSVKDLIANFNVDDESLSIFLGYLNDIYAGNPYSYSSELSRKSVGMFRDIATENQFKPKLNKWLIMGGLTHVDGGTKDTYYGKGYYTYDIGSSDMNADTKITGAYMLGEYGVSDTLTYGVLIGGNKLKSELSNGSKVDGDALYMGAYVKKYVGNLKVTGGLGLQYEDYDADRIAINKVASSLAEPVMKYCDNYNDMTYDIYLNGRYSHNIGENLFLEPYGTLSYTYIKQDSADEGSKVLAIETDSKSFDYTAAKVGVDIKKVIPHEKGKSILSAGVSYTRLLTGADEENITGRFKGENATDFDILVAHKNEQSIGLNAKYALELESGILFDVKGSYSLERDSHNGTGKNRAKGEWIVGAGIGYKF